MKTLGRCGLLLLVVFGLLAACAEQKPMVPDPDQGGNYAGDAGTTAPAPADTADAAAP